MNSARFAAAFARLRATGDGAFVPFVNLCDPDPELSLRILRALVAAGADALELGIPFSDPSADGPVIVASADRALRGGASTAGCLEVLRRFRDADPETPVSLMLYANLVFAPGVDSFFAQAAAAGADAVLIPDLPVVMRRRDPSFAEAAARHGLALVNLVPPQADPALLAEVASLTEGYTYLLSRVGITGVAEGQAAGAPLEEVVRALRRRGAPPLLLGFGVSRPEHVRRALAGGVDGVIVGSAIVRLIDRELERPERLLSELGAYAREMKEAGRGRLRPAG